MTTTTETLRWFKSSYSGGGGQCVEWAPGYAAATGELMVRDSKDTGGPALAFGSAAWSSFITAVRSDTFDA